ncbi:MAG: TetR family transcriptional regulator [Eubacterium sp.]|nr:TetR family transcriptional regulator [Eubacterium sp.]
MPKKTKEALISAFLELVKKDDFDRITVTDLVEKCGISRQTFYYHFDDIHQMLDWAFEAETKSICALQNPDDWGATEEKYIEFFNKYDVMLRKALKSIRFIGVFNRIEKSFYDCITSYIAAKRSADQNFGKNADYVISYTAGAYTALVVKTIQEEKSDYETIIKNLGTSLKGI